jgi:hypothetical protein
MSVAATLAYMNPDFASTYAQLVALASAGGAAGYLISTRVGPTELPQAVRAKIDTPYICRVSRQCARA